MIARSLVLMLLAVLLLASSASATDYYVATTGDNTDPGTIGSPWATISYSATQATAGDTVHIKGGNYGHEHVIISNSGTSGNNITFEGYDGTPILQAGDQLGYGIYIDTKEYIEVKNINITEYDTGVRVTGSSYIYLDNLAVTYMGGAGYVGYCISLRSYNNYCTVTNCIMEDAGAVGLYVLKSNNCVFEDNSMVNTKAGSAIIITDYYMVMSYCHDNIIRDCYVENGHQDTTAHPGHGIGIKDTYWGSYSSAISHDNLIVDCEAHGVGEHFYIAHIAYDNRIENCTAYNDDLDFDTFNDGFRMRDGAHNNTISGCRAIGTRRGLLFGDTDEGPVGLQYTDNNTIENCIFDDLIDGGINLAEARYTTIKNCVIHDAPELYTSALHASDNTLRNCIVTNITTIGETSPTNTYSNFYNNGFAMPSGTGNSAVDPLYANDVLQDFHLKSEYGRYSATGWVADASTSPCIDTGDASDGYSEEPAGNGGRINMGAYGNTSEASKSSGTPPPPPPPVSVDYDNIMKSGNPTSVYADTANLDAGSVYGTWKYRSWIWFNLSAYNTSDIINNASLRLHWYYNYSERNKSTMVGIYASNESTDPDYVTWNNYSSTGAWAVPGGTWLDANHVAMGTTPFASYLFPNTAPTNTNYTFNITHLVQNIVNGTFASSNGMLIIGNETNTNYMAFSSLENATELHRPTLTITYSLFAADHSEMYYSSGAPILNTINTTGYISFNRTVTSDDMEMDSFGLVVS